MCIFLMLFYNFQHKPFVFSLQSRIKKPFKVLTGLVLPNHNQLQGGRRLPRV